MGTILLNNKKTIFLIITILFFPLIYLNFNELMKTSPNIIKEKSNKENDSNSKDIKNIQKVIRIKNIKEKNIKSVLDNYLSTKQKDKYKLLKKNHLLFIEKWINKEKEKKLFLSIFDNNYNNFILLKDTLNSLSPSKKETFYFMSACHLKNKKIIEYLYENDKESVLSNLNSALHSKNFGFLNFLIEEKGFNINSIRDTFSLRISALGNKDEENYLKKYSADYNEYDYKNYQKLLGIGTSVKEFKRFQEEGFYPTNETLLNALNSLGSFKSNVKLAEYIKENINFPLNINDVNAHGNNALLSTASINRDNLDMVKWYVDNGYNIYAKNYKNENILDIATKNKREDIIIYYLEKDFEIPWEEAVDKIRSHQDLYLIAKKNKLEKVQKYMEENLGF